MPLESDVLMVALSSFPHTTNAGMNIIMLIMSLYPCQLSQSSSKQLHQRGERDVHSQETAVSQSPPSRTAPDNQRQHPQSKYGLECHLYRTTGRGMLENKPVALYFATSCEGE